MARRNTQPVTVSLTQAHKAFLEERIASGRFGSASEVVRASLNALEREEAHLDEWMKQKVEEAMANPGPFIDLDEAFDRVAARLKRAEDRGD